jgi:hypothetical protein
MKRMMLIMAAVLAALAMSGPKAKVIPPLCPPFCVGHVSTPAQR